VSLLWLLWLVSAAPVASVSPERGCARLRRPSCGFTPAGRRGGPRCLWRPGREFALVL